MKMHKNMERKFLPVSIALLTVSDTRVFETDKSGNLLANKIEQSGHYRTWIWNKL